MASPLAALSGAGVAMWLDDLSRLRLVSGSLHRLVRDMRVVGVTSNPTILANAMSGTDTYDEQLADLRRRGVAVGEALRMMTTYDVRWACDVLAPLYEASNAIDGRVSIEVDPRVAHDTDGTVAEARQLCCLVDRSNLFIKIPATREGLPAIAECIGEGISINATLIFSLERYGKVMEAFLEGLERARAAGARTVAVDVGRVVLRQPGRHRHRQATQRPLRASTGVKDPAYDDTRYVVDLVAPGVVNTMPEATLDAVADHGVISGDSIRPHYAHAQQVLDLAAAGIDYDDVVQVLEDEAVEKFEASWANETERLTDQVVATSQSKESQ